MKGGYLWHRAIKTTTSDQGTSRFISSKNLRLRLHFVLRSNPLSLRLVYLMPAMSHIRQVVPRFCRPSLANHIAHAYRPCMDVGNSIASRKLIRTILKEAFLLWWLLKIFSNSFFQNRNLYLFLIWLLTPSSPANIAEEIFM